MQWQNKTKVAEDMGITVRTFLKLLKRETLLRKAMILTHILS